MLDVRVLETPEEVEYFSERTVSFVREDIYTEEDRRRQEIEEDIYREDWRRW